MTLPATKLASTGLAGSAGTALASSPLPSPRVVASASSSAAGSDKLSPENYKFLQQEIYRDSGIVIDEDKHYLLDSRLGPVLRAAGLSNLEELCRKLRAKGSPQLSRQVTEALTTNETLFFRDMAPFEALRTRLLPELTEQIPASQPLRIWSAAASSGQEAYSVAMLLREQTAMQSRQVQILGTDLSEQILECAREAKYVQFEVNRGLPAAYLVKYFLREGLDWRLKDEIRKLVRFQQFDLRQSMAGLGRFHIIFCRNVLIYFDTETKNAILKQLWSALEPGGYLLLGSAESILHLQDKFERTADKGSAIYRRK